MTIRSPRLEARTIGTRTALATPPLIDGVFRTGEWPAASRFAFAAPLRSTEEFLAEARHSPKIPREFQTLLGEFLENCDLLKFARTFADRRELENLHAAAVRFVEETALARQEAAAA